MFQIRSLIDHMLLTADSETWFKTLDRHFLYVVFLVLQSNHAFSPLESFVCLYDTALLVLNLIGSMHPKQEFVFNQYGNSCVTNCFVTNFINSLISSNFFSKRISWTFAKQKSFLLNSFHQNELICIRLGSKLNENLSNSFNLS